MNSSERSLTNSYSQEDVSNILNLALARHSNLDSELSYAQLLEVAQELRITPESLELAERQWLDRQIVIAKNREFEAYRRSRLQDRLGKYAIVNVCLFPLNLLTGFGVPWSLYVLISWGTIRGVDAWRVFFQHQGYAYDCAFQRWERQQKMQKVLEI
jgi:2TM domain